MRLLVVLLLLPKTLLLVWLRLRLVLKRIVRVAVYRPRSSTGRPRVKHREGMGTMGTAPLVIRQEEYRRLRPPRKTELRGERGRKFMATGGAI